MNGSIPALLALLALAGGAGSSEQLRAIEWLELIPPEELKAMQEAAPILHFGGPAQQFQSFTTVDKMEGVRGKLPGFPVPIGTADDGKAIDFFLVPYFGACLHMPPPPPNQIVYVKPAAPVDLGSGWDPVWVIGTLRTTLTQNEVATASYTMEFEALEPYEPAQ